MRVELTLQQAAPWHDGVWIVIPAALMLHGILQQRLLIGLQRTQKALFDDDTPGFGEPYAFFRPGQQLQGAQAAGLGQDLTVQAAFTGGNQVRLHVFLELLESFSAAGLEGHSGIHGTSLQILLQRDTAAPPGSAVRSKPAVVQVFDGLFNVYRRAALRHRIDALQHCRRDDWR